MNFEMSNKKAYLIEILGIIIYIVLIAIGMFTYAGGTQDNPSAPGYTFWFNTFSDLGRVNSHNGNPNLISMVLFSIAYSTIAITMVPFYLVFPRLFNENTLEKKLTKIAAILGIISSIGFIGVVFLPADLFYAPHMFFAILAYVAILVLIILYTIALYRSEKFSKEYAWIFTIFSIVFLIFLLMALGALVLGIRALLTIGQKIGRISILICFPILTYGAWKLEYK
jgi:hypothetical membrane protein